MKNIIGLAAFALVFASCANSEQNQKVDTPLADAQEIVMDSPKEVNLDAPILSFEEEVYEFGVIEEGKVVEHVYTFTNTGKTPLIISNVSASCGCTTPEYSTHPINPGEQGSVSVSFDSNGQTGKQQKIITILSNAEPSRTIVQLKGEVKAKI